jgi:PAS domain S-box-containing protein
MSDRQPISPGGPIVPGSLHLVLGPDLRIVAASGEVTKVAGLRPDQVVGRPLGDLLPHAPDPEAAADRRAVEILESITDGFLALDADGRITYANAEAETLLGMPRIELLDRIHWDIFPECLGTPTEAALRRAVEEQAPVEFENHLKSRGQWFRVRAFPLKSGGLSIYFRDITEGKHSEAELARLTAAADHQRQVYEAALSTTPDLIYVFGLDHRFLYANEALLRMWGRTRDEALGKTCLELGYEPWHAEMHDREIEQVVAGRKPVRGIVPFTGTNGRRVYDYIFVPVLDQDDRVVAVAGTTRDVTDQQRTEQSIRQQARQLAESDRRKDEFLAMLAHELRNPLAAIGNALALAVKAGRTEHTEYSLGVIDRQSKHLSRLVDDLLDASRINLGKFELRKSLIELTAVLDSAVETVMPLVRLKGHAFSARVDRGRLWVDGDATRLEQVVVNLLNNAAKYSEPGGSITLTAEMAGGEIVLTVRDRGAGIPPDRLSEMFELFAQGDRTLARSEGGLGIGLTLVKRIVELHGGRVSASSGGPGEGSEFIATLPAAARPAGPGEEGEPDVDTGRGGARILVVDDNEDAAETLASLLRLLGHRVTTAHTGPAGVQEARVRPPDFLLLDIGLPGMDGYEMARQIRANGCCPDTTLIAISGYARDLDRDRSAAAGIHHHLSKPVDLEALAALLSR